MKKRKMMVTGGVAVALLLGSMGVRPNDMTEFRTDPALGLSLTQQGFSPSQIQKIYKSVSPKKDYPRNHLIG